MKAISLLLIIFRERLSSIILNYQVCILTHIEVYVAII